MSLDTAKNILTVNISKREEGQAILTNGNNANVYQSCRERFYKTC